MEFLLSLITGIVSGTIAGVASYYLIGSINEQKRKKRMKSLQQAGSIEIETDGKSKDVD